MNNSMYKYTASNVSSSMTIDRHSLQQQLQRRNEIIKAQQQAKASLPSTTATTTTTTQSQLKATSTNIVKVSEEGLGARTRSEIDYNNFVFCFFFIY